MPYEWVKPAAASEQSEAAVVSNSPLPQLQLVLWPYRSLPLSGFVKFISITCLLALLPLLALLGSPALWGILPFFLVVLIGIWFAFRRSYSDGTVTERLDIWEDRVRLVREGPREPRREWEANPHWVRVNLHRDLGPVPSYITLKGNGREVEIGAFLSEEEREALVKELRPLFGPKP